MDAAKDFLEVYSGILKAIPPIADKMRHSIISYDNKTSELPGLMARVFQIIFLLTSFS
jgi:hypothetical protein